MVRVLGDGAVHKLIIAGLSTAFGSIALLLACVGLYGVLSYSVSQRTREMGIGTALGARPAVLRGMVLREAAVIVVPGVVVGVVAVRATSRMIQAMLFGVSTLDPFVYAAVLAASGLARRSHSCAACVLSDVDDRVGRT